MSLTGPIVCIDDDEDDLHMMKKAIENLQVSNRLELFTDSEAAFDYLKTTQEKPFLILCDVNMPRLNGLDLRKRMNSTQYLRRKCIPFIFISTSARQPEVEVAYDQTVQGYFQKAVSFEGIEKQLGSIIAYWQECLHPNRDF